MITDGKTDEINAIISEFYSIIATEQIDKERLTRLSDRFLKAIETYGVEEIVSDPSSPYHELLLEKQYPILHKITTLEYAIDDIENNHIYCSSPSELNDPFECVIPVGKNKSGLISEAVLNILVDQLRIFLESTRSSTFVGSFTEELSIPMWAYYGNNGGGVSIDLDFSNLYGRYPIGRVIYSDDILDVAEISSISDVLIVKSGLYRFVKHSSWSHEKEWRLIHTQNKFDISGCIKSVTLGYNVDLANEDAAYLLRICRERSIPIRQAKLGRFGLDYPFIEE